MGHPAGWYISHWFRSLASEVGCSLVIPTALGTPGVFVFGCATYHHGGQPFAAPHGLGHSPRVHVDNPWCGTYGTSYTVLCGGLLFQCWLCKVCALPGLAHGKPKGGAPSMRVTALQMRTGKTCYIRQAV